jgi:hypothetical protein
MSDKFPTNMRGLIKESEDDKSSYTRAWDLCVLFLSGNQWLTYNDSLRQWSMDRPQQSNTRVTVNLLLNMYRNILSRMMVNYPAIAVLPASPSTSDIVKAKTSEWLLQYHWQADDMAETIKVAIEHLLSFGTVGFHTYYDPKLKRAHTDVVSPYDLFFEAKVSDPEESQWIAIRTYHTRSSLKAAYPDHEKEIEDAATTDKSKEGGPLGDMVPANRVETYEVYWRDGRHAILMGQTYLFKEENGVTDPFPVQIVRYSSIPTRLWGVGLVSPLVRLQWYYNKSRSQVLQNVELMGNPKWLIPKTAGVDTSSFTDRPGEKVYYNAAGGKPEMAPPKPLPGYVLDNITRIQSEMQDVAGIHSVTLGKRAVNVSSGSAIDVLSRNDMSQLQVSQNAMERGIKEVARLTLVIAKRYYTERKMLRMMDTLGSVVHKELDSTNLTEDPEVFLQPGSLFRTEAHDRDSRVLELFKLGLVDQETATRELSFRTSNAYVSRHIAQMSHAQDLLAAAASGYDIEIFASDDLKAFKQVWEEFMQSEDFYLLPEDRQDYLSDVYVAISTFGMGDEAYQKAAMNRSVWPRKTPVAAPEVEQATELGIQESQQALNQMGQEQVYEAARRDQVEDAVSRMGQRSEALISPVGPGY